jgi:Fe-S-cluster-containing hydrogenase component 2
MVSVNKDECTGCGICADVCPVDAISLDEGVATIDQDECTECLSCVDECPVEAIAQQ